MADGASRIKIHRPSRIQIRHDRAGMPRSGLGHEQVQAVPQGPTYIRTGTGPPAADSHPQRLHAGPARQPATAPTDIENVSVLLPCPLGAQHPKNLS